MYRKITSDTKTDSLLAMENAGRSAKPFLCELAQEVFRKENGEKRIDRRILHAFSQFKSKDLALIIDAKKSGVFDYGEFIVEVPGGYQYPKAADALKMLADALGEAPLEKEIEEDQPEQDEAVTSPEESMNLRILPRDIRRAELEGMNKRPLQQLHLAVTDTRSKRGEAAEHLIERILNVEFSDEVTEEAIANATTSKLENALAEDPQVREEPFDPRPAGPVVIINTVSADTESTVEAVVTAPTIKAAVEAVEAHSVPAETSVVDLAPHIEARKEEEEDVVTEISQEFAYEKSVLAGLRGIFVLVDILRRNQDTLANHLLEHGIQNRDWSKAPPEIIKDYDALVASIEVESAEYTKTEEEADQEDYEESNLQKEVAEEVQEFREAIEEEEAPVATSDNGHSEEEVFAKNYTGKFLTIDELRDMGTHDLQHYATQAGVENATAQAFTPLLIRQVLKRLDSIKSFKESLGQNLS